MRLRFLSVTGFLSLAATTPYLSGATASAPAPSFEFRGVSVAGAQTMVSLSLPDGSAKWVDVGREFSGYRVERYDPAKQHVVLTKDGVLTELPLKDANVQSVAAASPANLERDARLARWEKIKNLEGEELVKEFSTNPLSLEPQFRTAFQFLTLQDQSLSAEVHSAKQSLERGSANTDGSEKSKADLAALTKSLDGKSQAQKLLHDRLGQLAVAAKNAFEQSLAVP